jgi:hypothetical protein
LYLHQLFIEKKKTETPWRVLRVFGYDDSLEIRKGFVNLLGNTASEDYRFELTLEHGLKWLYGLFKQFDVDQVAIRLFLMHFF